MKAREVHGIFLKTKRQHSRNPTEDSTSMTAATAISVHRLQTLKPKAKSKTTSRKEIKN